MARIPEPSWGAVVWATVVGFEDRHTGYLVTGITAQGRDPLHRKGVVTDSLSFLLPSSWIELTVSFTEPKLLPTPQQQPQQQTVSISFSLSCEVL